MPKLLFLETLWIGVEDLEEVLALGNFPVCVGVDDFSEVFHEAEVGTHAVRQTRHLTQLGDQGDLVARLAVLVDEEGLVRVRDVLVVPGLVVLLVADL